jgi:hypothetical protein
MKNLSTEFKKGIQEQGLESFGLYYSTYAGIVEDNQDPTDCFRLKLKVPEIYGEDVSDWALPRGVFAGKGYGIFALPQKGDNVWVTFRNGNARFPLWEYGAIAKGEKPSDATGKSILFITEAGNRILIDEGGKIDISNDSLTLKELWNELFQWLNDSQVLTPAGLGKFNAPDLVKLETIKSKMEQLLK